MKTMKWGIIGAMPSEAELLKGQMEDLCEIKIGRLTFWEGLLCGQDAVIAVCGIGKVNAAITAQMMIDRFEVEAIINTGIAGAVHPDLKVLDVVISRELCYHDYDQHFLRDYPPYIDRICASESLVEAAVEAFQQITALPAALSERSLPATSSSSPPRSKTALSRASTPCVSRWRAQPSATPAPSTRFHSSSSAP